MINFRNFRINEEKDHHHDMTWMRANPLHQGHEAVVNAVKDSAKKHGGSHSVVMTSSHDNTKNPLTPEQKLKHAKRAFPDTNVSVADKSSPTILHHASKLHSQGVTNLHVHVGSDRVHEFKTLLNNYNGKESKHGHFNFKEIHVHAIGGDRSAASDGRDSYSATKMRKAAETGDKEAFHKMAPSKMSSEHKDEMMKDVKSGLDAPAVEKKKKLKESIINKIVRFIGGR